MPKSLDLRVLNQKTWGLTLLDGTELKVLKPNKSIELQMEQLKDGSEQESIEGVPQLILEILNNNQSGVVFHELPKGIDISHAIAIIKGYSEWLFELMSDPN